MSSTGLCPLLFDGCTCSVLIAPDSPAEVLSFVATSLVSGVDTFADVLPSFSGTSVLTRPICEVAASSCEPASCPLRLWNLSDSSKCSLSSSARFCCRLKPHASEPCLLCPIAPGFEAAEPSDSGDCIARMLSEAGLEMDVRVEGGCCGQ